MRVRELKRDQRTNMAMEEASHPMRVRELKLEIAET